MKKLPLLLLLITLSSNIMAKVGDTYICNMGEHYSSENWFEGVYKKEFEAFTFKRENNSISISSKKGGFASGVFDVYYESGSEDFEAKGWKVLIAYNSSDDDISENGMFNYVILHSSRGMTTVVALCNILND
jgi:hypothetical protein